MRNLLLLSLCFFHLIGCATNMRKQFNQVKVGMEKDDVLGLLDSPQRSERWRGLDRWTYIFYDEDMRFEKEVHFADGKAAYVGDVYKPAISAAEQDTMNETSNRAIEAVYQAQREENKRNFGNTNGSDPSDQQNSFVPQFKPVQ